MEGQYTLGNAAGFAAIIPVTPPVTAGIYHANDVVGGLQTLANAVRVTAAAALLQSIMVLDKGNQAAQLTLYFFNANPADSTFADNGALTIHANDWDKLVGVVAIAAADYGTVGTRRFAHCTPGTHTALGKLMKSADTSLFVIATTTGTPTYAAVDDLTITYEFLQID